jgi:hypothetical protein
MKDLFRRALLGFVLVCATATASHAYEQFTQADIDALLQVRPQLFGGSELQAALEQTTINGVAPPIFGYDLSDRAIISWKVADHMAEAFAEAIGLPPFMTLAKAAPVAEFRIPQRWHRAHRQHQPKNFYIVLEVGNASRYVQGTLVEWKTFVTVGGDPTPRLVRFDVQAAVPGVDLLEIFNPPFGAVNWTVNDDLASGLIADAQGRVLSIDIPRVTLPRWLRWLQKRRFSEEYLTAGERTFSPRGAQSRYYYDGSSVSARVTAVDPHKVSINNTFPWAAFTGDLTSVSLVEGKTQHLVQPIGLPVAPGSSESGLFAQLTGQILGGASPDDVFAALAQASDSPSYPTLYYGVLQVYQALQIFAGQEPPKLTFSLKVAPKTVFINFEIPKHKVEAFKDAFLPDHFELARMRFYPEQRRPVYAVSLNVYDSVGTSVSGLRAEWSTYVINPNEENPKPRFSIIEAQTSGFGLDPLSAREAIRSGQFDPDNLFSLIEGPSDVFEFSLDETNGLHIDVQDFVEGIVVDVSVPYPPENKILRTRPLKRWMEANDLVYWGEVADILKYDSNVMYADMIVFRPGKDAVIMDNTFEEYVNPRPLPIIYWDGVQDIALEPWGNLQDVEPQN